MPFIEYQNGHPFYQLPTMQGRYPTYDIPPIVRDAILETSTILNMPVQLVAQVALAVMSLVCQFFINVKCPNFGPAPVALFLMAIVNSSGGKTVLEERYLRAVLALERKEKEDHEAELPVYRAELKIWKDDDRRLSKDYRNAEQGSDEARSIHKERLLHEQKRPVQPTVRELRFADLSPEGLRDMLVANGALGILSPDAGPVVNGRTFSQPALLCGYWSGEDRPVGLAGGNRRPVEPRLTVSLMLQKVPFLEFMKERADDFFGTGLGGRTLTMAIDSNSLHRQETCVEDVPEPKLGLFNDRVTQVLSQVIPAPRERVNLKPSDAANRDWKCFKDAINDEISNGDHSENIESFLRKLAQQASRIAALFHYFEGESGDISSKAMRSAISLCEWYAHEYVRIFTPYAPSPQQKDSEASQRLLDWLQAAAANPMRYPKLTPGRYTERELSNYSAIRGDPAVLAKAIEVLYGQGCISIMYGKKGGRIICHPPAPMYPPPQPQPWPQQNYQAPQVSPLFASSPTHRQYADTDSLCVGAPTQPGINSTMENKKMTSSPPKVDDLKRGENGRAELLAVKEVLQEFAMKAYLNRERNEAHDL